MRVAVDFHDVLADLKRPVIALLNARLGLSLRPEDLTTWKCWETGRFTKSQFYDAVNAVRNRGLDPLPGAVSGLRALIEQHDVSIVSGTRDPYGIRQWLAHHDLRSATGAALPVYAVVADDTHAAKLKLGFDAYVDDNPMMAEVAMRTLHRVVVFDQPWNARLGVTPRNVQRATTWHEVVDILGEAR